MSTLFDAPDWRCMIQQDRDNGLNKGAAVAGSGDIVAGWCRRSADMRARHSGHLDLRYGPRERNRIDFFNCRKGANAAVHPWRLLADAAKEVFSLFAGGPMMFGINVAMIGYTLAPEATLDRDRRRNPCGIDFLVEQLPALGGDTSRIVVSGWSAGGHLTAMALSHPQVKAAMAISGIYDLEPIRHSYLNVKLGLDEAMSHRNSPMMQPGGAMKPLSLVVGAPNCRCCASRPQILPATAPDTDCR